MRVFVSLVILTTLSTIAHGQNARFRAVQWQPPQFGDRVNTIYDNGDSLFKGNGGRAGVRYRDGSTSISPSTFAPYRILEDGTVWGQHGMRAGRWNPGTGQIQDQSIGTFPSQYTYSAGVGNLAGGFTMSVDDGNPSGYTFGFVSRINEAPLPINGGSGFYGVYFRGADGLMVGAVDAGSAGGMGKPAIWTPDGSTFATLTSPGMIAGNAYFRDKLGSTFGVVSKRGARPGWYGTWWNPDGTFSREFFIDPLSFDNPLIGPWRQIQHWGEGQVVFNSKQAGDQYARAYYWSSSTGMVSMDSLVDDLPSGWTITAVNPASPGGRMVVQLQRPDLSDSLDNYYLEPVPEPASLAGLALGLGWLARRRRAKGG